ncbi:hypothetical protein [Stakelama pacifica]|uniref:Uncharacterized protein n=1 Tax=Stakelama pacifica TaxID=517720 RepID=A0A4R6FPI5_9SPHN|nr:hypothetical protein [Stakelama pacifica]TDN83571.1 hypothetical protein EV664_10454 [Stakelama pacifica]GGO94204.1 hypothetical protein GCM10011329_15430 [Stakelama pacifica]|tara:strand:- start:156 stop:332 length:177 start_codon:yes stop_codon:yes gene_type:complete
MEPYHRPHNQPLSAVAEKGQVLLDGPRGVAISLTPDAARQTATALQNAADEAERPPEG